MKTEFYIVLNIRTAAGFERFGQFELGTDRRVAEALFAALEGREADNENEFLQLDLMEKLAGLPVSLHVLNCTAGELARNVKYIAREMFKWRNLEEGS
jgi:hypothetical protein